MDCKETDRLIPAFLKNELSGRELKGFMEHISGCDECREELSIQFLILEGMARLENGNTFDLQAELDRRLEDAARRMRLRKGLHFLVYGLEFLVIITIITIIIMITFL